MTGSKRQADQTTDEPNAKRSRVDSSVQGGGSQTFEDTNQSSESANVVTSSHIQAAVYAIERLTCSDVHIC